ncbi:MAG: biotin--[acetyl-CoA-carboxylase] ligase [Gemmatimonadota bacterium]|nr:biotin--[acetyl-CoA-carboxylase] ligase [Gemmatimonadota bacterium]
MPLLPPMRLESVPTTQDVIHELAEGGAPTGTVVVARRQTGGRGSRGRQWSAPVGGLWLSVLCRPPEEAAIAVLSLRVGLAVAAALEQGRPGIQVRLKWPNDLLLADRKLGGVLCEARWQGGVPAWVAVGVGINVVNPLPPELRGAAISLGEVVPDITPGVVEPAVLSAVRAAGSASGGLTRLELSEYSARDWLLGRGMAMPLAGTGAGLAPDGSLLVRLADGRIEPVRSGTVELADSAARHRMDRPPT